LNLLDNGRDASHSFDPGPTARPAGPLTRLRRSFAAPRATVVNSRSFDPGLSAQMAGPLTKARRSGSAVAIELPLAPRLGDVREIPWELPSVERLGDIAFKAAPAAVVALGLVTAASMLAKPGTAPRVRHLATPVAPPVEPAAVSVVPAPPPAPPLGKIDAKLVGDRAVVPASAPAELRQTIAAANEIKDRPYVYGGGHGSFSSSGYDCSGSVSYALHGGGFISSPMASTGLESWGEPGPGKAITVYANGGHAFAVIAGLRWDTSGTGDSGPSWQPGMRSSSGYVARHPAGY
jgi:hypothetical protein